MNNSEPLSSPEEKWTAYLDGKLPAQDATAIEREHPEASAERAMHARIISAVRLHSPAPKLRNADFEGQLAAIGQTQAVVTFTTGGLVTDANKNFLNLMGYTREQVLGIVDDSNSAPGETAAGQAHNDLLAV